MDFDGWIMEDIDNDDTFIQLEDYSETGGNHTIKMYVCVRQTLCSMLDKSL